MEPLTDAICHEAKWLKSSVETVRKVPEVPETRAHKAPKTSRTDLFGPYTRAK